ncbi:C-type lectin lectoxin-Thr1-like isoform X2 [Phyllobates terribilis]|uniref:C-type lectin lectoxin-Thr1-like isoform X2 n=1 Tax=Phyllobates terribilis TaxID=111132 RepID=UPI003CCB3D3C
MKNVYEHSLDESNTDMDASSANFNETFFSHIGRYPKKSHGWLSLALIVTLGIIFIILGILTGILFGHYATLSNELTVLKFNVSEPVMKNDVSELWKSVSNIMGDLSKLKDTVDISEGSCKSCPHGWTLIRSNCYFFSSNSETWERSKELCAEKNGILIAIKNEIEMDLAKHLQGLSLEVAELRQHFSLLKNIKQNNYWLGLKRNPEDIEMWEWTDGSPLTFSAWNTGEPNNDKNNEHCGEIMGPVQLWNDLPCTQKRKFLCKGVWSC